MTTIRLRKLSMPLAFLLSLVLIFEGLSVVVFATDSTPTADTEADTGAYVPDPMPPSEGQGMIESDVIISPPNTFVGGGESEISPMATQVLSNGVYCFKNKGNTGLYMDTQYDSSSTNAKLQQYAYSTNPTTTLANGGMAHGGLFKVSYRADLDAYVIRSMTNNLLSYEFSGGYVVTKQIAANDADVAAADTFKIVRVTGASVSITPYGQSQCIAAQNTTSSGSGGAPYSYLIASTTTASGDQALWQPIRYSSGTARHGYLLENVPNQFITGEAYSIKVKTWSSVVNANVPYMDITSNGLTSWGPFASNESQLPIEPHYDGTFTLNIYIKSGSTVTYQKSLSYVIDLPIEEGTYAFQNRQTEKYMQIDDPGSATMEVLNREDIKEQKWIIVHITGKYYKIQSKSNLLYLTVPSGSYDSNNVQLRLQASSSANGQLWYFEKPHADVDSYVIRPKSGEDKTTDWCINVKTTILGTSASDVVQSTYVDNSSYYDEWVLECLNPKDITIIGIPSTGHIHSANTDEIRDVLRDGGFDNINLDNDVMSPDECLEYLTETKIFISRSHGEAFKNTTGVGETSGIILSNFSEEYEASRVGLYSHASSQIPVNGSYIASNESFENLELAVFVGCETGYVDATDGNVGPGNNLPYLMVQRGAEVAIGFRERIDCGQSSTWTKVFIDYMLTGCTVEEAINLSLQATPESSAIHSLIWYGDGNYTLND